MPCLVILRGPPAVGKTSTKDYLMQKLGKDVAFLHLDIIESENNPASTTKFLDMLSHALKSDKVIGEMYFGDSHTTDPKWLDLFREKGYCIMSVVLKASYATCLKRWQADLKRITEDIKMLFDQFEARQRADVFAKAANLKEILIDAETKTVDEIGNEILKKLDELCPNCR